MAIRQMCARQFMTRGCALEPSLSMLRFVGRRHWCRSARVGLRSSKGVGPTRVARWVGGSVEVAPGLLLRLAPGGRPGVRAFPRMRRSLLARREALFATRASGLGALVVQAYGARRLLRRWCERRHDRQSWESCACCRSARPTEECEQWGKGSGGGTKCPLGRPAQAKTAFTTSEAGAHWICIANEEDEQIEAGLPCSTRGGQSAGCINQRNVAHVACQPKRTPRLESE